MEKLFPWCGKLPGGGASRKQVLRSARCARGDGARPGAAPARGRAVTSPAGLRARRCPPGRFPAGRAARGFYSSAAGRRGAAVSPAWVFPPAPPFRRRPLSSADHRPGGKPIPVRSLALPRWGQPHGGQFRFFCRRPSGPPAEISPPLTEPPRPPAVLRGPIPHFLSLISNPNRLLFPFSRLPCAAKENP